MNWSELSYFPYHVCVACYSGNRRIEFWLSDFNNDYFPEFNYILFTSFWILFSFDFCCDTNWILNIEKSRTRTNEIKEKKERKKKKYGEIKKGEKNLNRCTACSQTLKCIFSILLFSFRFRNIAMNNCISCRPKVNYVNSITCK